MFAQALAREAPPGGVGRLTAELYGSLGATGKGHGTDKAVVLGLAGHDPETVDIERVDAMVADVRGRRRVALAGECEAPFDPAVDIIFYGLKRLPLHANGMRFAAYDAAGKESMSRTYYSVGGGFVVRGEEDASGEVRKEIVPDIGVLPLPFRSGEELLRLAAEHGCSIAEVMRRNERHWRTDAETERGLDRIWQAMRACVSRGCSREGLLPGPFKVRRRAAALKRRLEERAGPDAQDPLATLDYVNLYALAVNEENAAGGRVVTAPTNGAAGVIPAVLHYYAGFVPGATGRGVQDFLLTAAAIGILYKENASISGAEVGCQGEVGVACSMAAGALCAVLGGTPRQVENAAEIGMEHHLGLTCDPVGGLVQIPCIERNAIAAVKAINAARMALHGDGDHLVSLDKVIKTMRETGADMMAKYKETSRGGLAVNIVEC